ncbi:MAG: alpha/beta hydrolase [Rhodoglobus sp.]|nr:alpha/beta hydrolase [Rhodoglobus sp.]
MTSSGEHAPRRFFSRGAAIVVTLALVLALLVAGFLVYANMVMRGEREAAISAWTNPAVSIESTDHSIVMSPTGASDGVGLVFIPGAKVDPYAYLFVLSGIVEHEGVTVVITKPTLNLAFFDFRPLTTFTSDAPEVTEWFVGGHSLGGVRACMLADDPGVEGLVLFGSYCATDLSATGLKVLSVGGSEDGLSTPKKISDAASLLPPSAAFVEIEGLNHARFGNYGTQSGDGAATITSGEARATITDIFGDFLSANR